MILLDGAMGTELERMGLDLPAPGWSAVAVEHHADAVMQIHRAYAASGATVHTAATFRTRGIATHRAVELCRAAVPSSHRVAGSMAPVADCYRPDLSPPEAHIRHRQHAADLADADVDLLLVETFAHPAEVLVAAQAALDTGLETWVALTPGFDGSLLSPADLQAVARTLHTRGVDRVLVNCCPAETAHRWLDLDGPWGIYANGRGPTGGISAAAWAEHARRWRDAGASVVGGCCYTTPDHIRATHEALFDPVPTPFGST